MEPIMTSIPLGAPIAERSTPSRAATRSAPGSGLSRIVRQFTPNWFTVTMGTGVLALALDQVASAIPGLHVIALSLWALNIALFTLYSVLYAARWILFFDAA